MIDPTALADPHPVEPFHGPVDAVVRPPGSKSLTNRFLLLAALAEGSSTLRGVLDADDTAAMTGALRRLGIDVRPSSSAAADEDSVEVRGTGGRFALDGSSPLDAALSGTTARFLAPVLALASSPVELTGGPPLRSRPMADVFDALRRLGVAVDASAGDQLPARIGAAGGHLPGGSVSVSGRASSQFLSGLLMVGPYADGGLTIEVEMPLVSRPYIDLTIDAMARFGVTVERAQTATHERFVVAEGRYRATDLEVEPDASAASYFFGAAAVCGGSVRVDGLGRNALQGDARFPDVLAEMGCRVERTDTATTLTGGPLVGIEVDLVDLSDTAQTLAAVAPFAESPTRVTGIGFIRRKETDRIGNVVTELRRLHIHADEEADGFLVRPGPASPGIVQTYHDHRMAMAFALLGLVHPGIQIADPGCVAKTFPGYWTALERLRPT